MCSRCVTPVDSQLTDPLPIDRERDRSPETNVDLLPRGNNT
jgi:hypothetical protein